MRRVRSFWPVSIACLLLGIFCACFSGNVLRQAQPIKQFHTVSMTRSLVENGFQITKTYLPCPDIRDGSSPRPWVEEPPTYSSFAALLQSVGLKAPQWPSLMISLGTTMAIAWLIFHFGVSGMGVVWILLGSVAVPVFMGHYYVHIPDLLALLFLVLAANSALSGRTIGFALCLVLAVTTKALAIFPGSALVLWYFWVRPLYGQVTRPFGARLIGSVCVLVAAVLPFITWVSYLEHSAIPNPFNFSSVVENRHSGSWSVIFSARYLEMFFTFVGTQGVGWILFVGFLLGIRLHLKRWKHLSSYHSLLYCWVLGGVLMWLFVRAASTIHGHYVLQYFLPVALLGAEYWLNSFRKFGKVLLVVSILVALSYPIKSRRAAGDLAPDSFCQQEEGSLIRFSLPAKSQ